MNLPSDAQVAKLHLIDTPRMAELAGMSKDALYMRIRRGSFPSPHFRVGGPFGCFIWVATSELCDRLSIRPEDL